MYFTYYINLFTINIDIILILSRKVFIMVNLIFNNKTHTEILLTRHGQTEWNFLKKVQGKLDIPLNEKGIKQAQITKSKLQNEEIDLILSSPLIRAVETAKIINTGKNIPLFISKQFSERDFGEFEGMANYNFDYEAFWSYKQNLQYEKAENIRLFFNRVYSALDEIYLKYKGKRILLVGHAGISIPVYCYFNGIPNIDTLLDLAIDNCEVVKYVYKERE